MPEITHTDLAKHLRRQQAAKPRTRLQLTRDAMDTQRLPSGIITAHATPLERAVAFLRRKFRGEYRGAR